jgi:glycosyltransferase involved in cell wall biosynthesis
MIAKRFELYVDLAALAPTARTGAAPAALEPARLSRMGIALHLLLKPGAESAVGSLAAQGAVVHLLGTRGEVREPKRALRTHRRVSPPFLRRLLGDRSSLVRRGAGALLSPLGSAVFHEPGLPHVATVHDFQELDYPGFFPTEELARRRAFRQDLRRADRVVVSSAFTREMAVTQVRISEARTVVLPPLVPRERAALGEAEVLSRLSRLGLARGAYAVYPANFWPHKNHATPLGAAGLPLSRDPGLCSCSAERSRTAAGQLGRGLAAGLGGAVRILGFQSDLDVTALLQGARLLLGPSLYEGFGLPVLEAFRLGTPVACSQIPALEELAGSSAHLFEASEGRSIQTALEKVWLDEGYRSELARRGRRRAASFDDAETVSRWIDLLEEIVPEHP